MVGQNEYLIILTAALPLAGLTGAIPLGLLMGVSPLKTLSLAIVGNLIPVIPLFFLFKPVHEILRKSRFLKGFFDGYLKKTKERAKIVEKYQALGLAIFVAIPLPFAGAWTGAICASLFGLRFRSAFLAIICGVILAGVGVTILSMLGIITFRSLFIRV